MARTGVSYTEVAETVAQLIEQGRNPTVEQVRFILGTGSSTTIAKHLRQWKAKQEAMSMAPAKETLPPEFVAMMKGLWERVINHSEEQVAVIENDYQQTISALQQEVEKYKTNNQRWQKMYDQWMLEKSQFASDKLTLEQALEFSHKENTSLHAKQDGLLQQLQDKQERIDDLYRLHKQAQENLEHYRESAREQRLLDQQQYEQQKQQLQSEIKMLNEQLVIHREKVSELQQQHQILLQSHTVLENDYEQMQFQRDQLRLQHEESEKVKTEYLQNNQQLQNQNKELQNNLNGKHGLLLNMQAENKLISQQLMDAKKALIDAKDQNKLLSIERLVVVQEKAQLEGQLKQMQKMINA